MTDELRAVSRRPRSIEAQVRQFEQGLKYVQGRFEGILEPGRHAFWNHPAARVAVQVLDTRVQQLKIEGQELMTRDKVTLRLTLTAEYAPADAPTTVHAVADVKDALYLAVQLAAREFVAGVTLDELLEGRDTLTRYLEAQVMPRAETFGVRLHRVGVKDVILPGEMKTLLNKVIEAEKAAAANVILRREDAAATRNMAQHRQGDRGEPGADAPQGARDHEGHRREDRRDQARDGYGTVSRSFCRWRTASTTEAKGSPRGPSPRGSARP